MAAGRLTLARAALLALPVLLVHLWLGESAMSGLPSLADTARAMPPRLQVSFQREMQVAPAPTAPAPQRLRRLAAASPALAPALPSGLSAERAPAEGLESLPELALPDPAVEDREPGPEWPLSTRLDYALTGHYQGPVHGDAQVEWLRRGSRYQVRLDVSVGPRLAPFVTRQMSSEGLLTPRGIAPQRFDEATRLLLAPRRRITMNFDGGRLTLADGRSEAAPPGVQDASSQFVQLTWLFLTGREVARPGHVVTLPLALPRRQYPQWAYVVVGEVLLETPLGPLSTWHLKPVHPPAGGDLATEMWLAPQLQWLPVRLLIREPGGSYADLMLRRAPLQEEATADGPSIVAPIPKETPQ